MTKTFSADNSSCVDVAVFSNLVGPGGFKPLVSRITAGGIGTIDGVLGSIALRGVCVAIVLELSCVVTELYTPQSPDIDSGVDRVWQVGDIGTS